MFLTDFLNRHLHLLFLLLLSAGATAAEGKNTRITLENTLAELEQSRLHIINDAERTRERLSAAEADLKTKEKELHSAINAAKTDEREKVQREATLVSIIYNRELARTERLQKDLAEFNFQLEAINKQQRKVREELDITLNNQRLASISAEQSAAATPVSEKPKTATAPAVTPLPTSIKQSRKQPPKQSETDQHPATWPTAEQPRPQDIAYAKTRLFPATAVNPQTSIFTSVKITSALFGTRVMDFAGNKLYTTTLTGKPGTQTFTVFKHQFWHTFPADAGSQKYIVVYDAESLSAPELIIFPAILMQ